MSRAFPTKGSPEALAWAEKMQAARRKKRAQVRSAGLQTEKKFFGPRGVFAKAGHTEHLKSNGPFYNGTERAVPASRVREIPPPRERHKSNPLAIIGLGNPPKRISATVAGIVYSRCLEIRAEKLKYNPGLYKHPFDKKAGVQVLALDNGDLLIHSTRGMKLWEPA